MVRDVNQRYYEEHKNSFHSNNGNRLLIERIGMQEHHNTGINVNSVRAAITLFRSLGVKLSVTELDVLGQSWNQFGGNDGVNKHSLSAVTNQGLLDQAKMYGELMALYIENADIIERVTLWGVLDNLSWRSAGLPLLFDPQGRAKPAYYSFVAAAK